MTNSQHIYEVRPRKDKRRVDLISDALPFGRLWYLCLTASLEALRTNGDYFVGAHETKIPNNNPR
jgi:hypothetical protein